MSKKLVRALACGAALIATALPAAQAADRTVTVYDATQLALGSFVVVERIGAQGWRSAFGVPGHRTEQAAQSAVLARAAQAGADGVINLKCMAQTDRLFNPAGHYCYANAIRLRNERRAGSSGV